MKILYGDNMKCRWCGRWDFSGRRCCDNPECQAKEKASKIEMKRIEKVKGETMTEETKPDNGFDVIVHITPANEQWCDEKCDHLNSVYSYYWCEFFRISNNPTRLLTNAYGGAVRCQACIDTEANTIDRQRLRELLLNAGRIGNNKTGNGALAFEPDEWQELQQILHKMEDK